MDGITQLKPPHVLIVPTPGIGHLIPLVQLAKRLILLHHNFLVTFIIPTDGVPTNAQTKLLNSLPPSISYTFLPPVNFDDLPPDVKIETLIYLTLNRSLPALRDSLKALTQTTRVVSLIVDLFGCAAFDVSKEFGVPPHIFFPTTAMALLLVFHLPKLHEVSPLEYRDWPEPIKLPGCVPVHGRDLPDPVQDKNDESYEFFLLLSRLYTSAAGIMVNSVMDLETGAFQALTEGKEYQSIPPVCPVGPIIYTGSTDYDRDCLSWLDNQPNGSVLFMAFGSGGTLSHDQIIELAYGLEMSRRRFIWVLKVPSEKSASATYFNMEESSKLYNPFEFLPNGFLERTKEVGLVIPFWAPQVQILSHASTGGFMSHCGWNSSLESIVSGVPLIAWPLYAEQRTNAVLLGDDLKVAVRVKMSEKGIVDREEVRKCVNLVFEGVEGKAIRDKMKVLKDKATTAIGKDGCSTKSLGEVAEKWIITYDHE